MTERCMGITVEGSTVTIVEAQLPDDPDAPIEIVLGTKWDLQDGEPAAAYAVMSRRCTNFVKENGIKRIFVKATTAPLGRVKVAPLLSSAELRGVVIAAAACVGQVTLITKQHISRTYGDQSFDEYCKDDGFWAAQTTGVQLRKFCRPAAMIIVAGRN